MTELAPARPLDFQGEKLESGTLDVGWVRTTKATLKPAEKAAKGIVLPRFTKVHVATIGKRIDVTADGKAGSIDAKDLSIPTLAAPPAEIHGAERWIDIDLASQTLVAYEGPKPTFATLVSTGKGPKGSELATPTGTFRIWVKLRTTDMDNLEKDLADDYYSIADVPYVQFFHKGVALHATFWHRDLGHVHSHGCVNLVPEDARYLFGWTAPHVPSGWDAVLPSVHEKGTLVRVR
jgi:lipoprotein-anchoring transpeptidase ErfK/SrfK